MTKLKKTKNKEKNEIYKVIISCALVLIVIFFLGLYYKGFYLEENNKNAKQPAENLSFYDDEKCRCVERERLKCNDGFELDLENRFCRSGKDITNVILSCSKYECSGVVYEFNFKNENWEMKSGGVIN